MSQEQAIAKVHAQLSPILKASQITTDQAECWTYGHDYSRRHAPPEMVVFAHSHEDVAATVKACYDHHVPVIAHGGASGATGGCVPTQGGVVLSLEPLNQILSFDPDNRLMVVQSGVFNQAVQQQASLGGFFWPPDPTSSAHSTIGGNLACNAAGPKAVKYGSCRENVLGLKAVIGTGETIFTGGHTSKNAVGYDLTRLLIGQEGTLAIITEAILKLTPKPSRQTCVQCFYKDIHSAAIAVSAIMAQPNTPCALELMDEGCLEALRSEPDIQLPDDTKALLIIEVDGEPETVALAQRAILQAATNQGLIQTLEASTKAQTELIWAIRQALPGALRKLAPKKINEDIVVPVTQIPTLIEELKKLEQKYQIPIVNFGHAGNGNLHTNLLIDPENQSQAIKANDCLQDLFHLVLALQGSLSGEHGIGLEKKPYFTQQISQVSLHLMQQIKHVFDPHGVFNPGKIFDIQA